MKITHLNGKTVKMARKVHKDAYIQYLFEFTDGTKIMFRGTSSANIEIIEINVPKAKKEAS